MNLIAVFQIMSAAPNAVSSSMEQPVPSQTMVLFARGVWSLLHLWPALRLAVANEWGGSESREKRTWFISMIVDEFEEKSAKSSSSSAPSAPGSMPSTSEPVTIPPPFGLDLDSVADLLFDILLEEFEIEVEDGSPVEIAKQIIKLWSDAKQGIETEILRLEEEEAKTSKKKIVATQGADQSEVSDAEDWSEDDDDEDIVMDGETAPQLVERQKEKEEPEIDEDGFTMVKGKGRK